MYLCPSRGRPHNIQRLIQAYYDTDSTQEILLRVDDNDPSLHEYMDLEYPDSWILTVGPQVKAGGAMREAFSAFPGKKYYGFIGDDAVPKTKHWDTELAKSADGWFISYPDDQLQGEAAATHPVCGGELIRSLG